VPGLQASSLMRGFYAAYRDHNTRQPNFGHDAQLSSYDWWSGVVGATLAHASPELGQSEGKHTHTHTHTQIT
jgi:hypothetical protein